MSPFVKFSPSLSHFLFDVLCSLCLRVVIEYKGDDEKGFNRLATDESEQMKSNRRENEVLCLTCHRAVDRKIEK